jgi:hypothetical protein
VSGIQIATRAIDAATVEFAIEGPCSYAEAVQLADVRLSRLDLPDDNKALNGIKKVAVTSLATDRQGR